MGRRYEEHMEDCFTEYRAIVQHPASFLDDQKVRKHGFMQSRTAWVRRERGMSADALIRAVRNTSYGLRHSEETFAAIVGWERREVEVSATAPEKCDAPV